MIILFDLFFAFVYMFQKKNIHYFLCFEIERENENADIIYKNYMLPDQKVEKFRKNCRLKEDFYQNRS